MGRKKSNEDAVVSSTQNQKEKKMPSADALELERASDSTAGNLSCDESPDNNGPKDDNTIIYQHELLKCNLIYPSFAKWDTGIMDVDFLIDLPIALFENAMISVKDEDDGLYRINMQQWFEEKPDRKKKKSVIEKKLREANMRIIGEPPILLSLLGIERGMLFPVYKTVFFEDYVLCFEFTLEAHGTLDYPRIDNMARIAARKERGFPF